MFSHAVYGAGEDRRAVRHIYVSLCGVYSCRAFHTWDVDTDCDDNFQNGIQRIFEADADTRPGDAWGALGAWAFAASRICDWLQMQPQITENFPSWFCRNYRRYAGCEEEMPFEQHMRFMIWTSWIRR